MGKNIVWEYKGTFSNDSMGLYNADSSGRVSAPSITKAAEMAIEEIRRSGTGHILGIQVRAYVSPEEHQANARQRKDNLGL